MEWFANSSSITLTLNSKQYSEEVLHKCFYWYTAEFYLSINRPSPECFCIELTPKKPMNLLTEAPLLERRVQNDLVDFRLREMVDVETRTIRELLVAKAFAHYDTEQPLSHELLDPVETQRANEVTLP